MKNVAGWKIAIRKPSDFTDKDAATKRCLVIANEACFPTDYNDMYEHLFGNDDAKLFVVMDEKDEIYGFASVDKIDEFDLAYLHGIIVHPEAQSMGFGVKLVREAIDFLNTTFLMARTHNPRIYDLMERVSHKNLVYPNVTKEVPDEVKKLIMLVDDTQGADADWIVRNAYPDEKISQSSRSEFVQELFSHLGMFDAQVIVSVTKDVNFNI